MSTVVNPRQETVGFRVQAFALARGRVEGLERPADCILAHTTACALVEDLIRATCLLGTDAMAAVRVDPPGRGTVVAGHDRAAALAGLVVKDVFRQQTFLGDVRAHALTRLQVKPLHAGASRRVRALTGASVLIEHLGRGTLGAVRAGALAEACVEDVAHVGAVSGHTWAHTVAVGV